MGNPTSHKIRASGAESNLHLPPGVDNIATLETSDRQAISHFDTVDLLRGFAVLAVVMVHIGVVETNGNVKLVPGLPPWAGLPLIWSGLTFFRVFFPISGFLITLISIRRFGSLTDIRPLRFYRIRFARIAPLLLLIMLILNCMHLAHVPGFVINTKRISLFYTNFAVLTFHVNWVMAWVGILPLGWSVMWSLSIEELFYFLFPLATFLLRWRAGKAVFFTILSILIAVGPFARTVITNNVRWHMWSYLGSMDGIAMGCLTALVVDHFAKRTPLNRHLLAWVQVPGAAAILGVLIWPYLGLMHRVGRGLAATQSQSGLEWSIVSYATCLILFGSVLGRDRSSRWSAPLRWLGSKSYEMYLTHEIVISAMAAVFLILRKPGGITGELVLSFAMFPMVVVVGWATARYFSEPMNAYLRRWKPAKTQALQPPSILVPTLVPAQTSQKAPVRIAG